MANEMKLLGAKALEGLLKKLPDRLAKNVTVNGLRAGGRVLAKGMTQRAPKLTGELSESPVVSSAKKATRNQSQAVVGFLTPTSRRVHLTEFGTEHSPAQPFIRPTLDIDGPAAVAAITENMAKGVEREARALASGSKSFVTGKRIR